MGFSTRNLRFSYFSVLLLLWSFFFTVRIWHTNYVHAPILLLLVCLCNIVWHFDDGKLILSFLLLSELLCVINLQDKSLSDNPGCPSIILFYASVQFLFTCMCFETRVVTRCQNVIKKVALLVLLCSTHILITSFWIHEVEGEYFVQVVVYLMFAHLCFGTLQPLIGVEESSTVSSIMGLYAADAFAAGNHDSLWGCSSDVGYQCSSFEYVISRELLVFSFSFMLVVSMSLKLLTWWFEAHANDHIPPQLVAITFWLCLTTTAYVWWESYSFPYRFNVFQSVVEYILNDSARLWIVTAWVLIIPASVLYIHLATSWMRKTIRRKMFHFLAVCSFTVPTIIAPEFLCMCISIVSSICIIIEVGRFHHVLGFNFFSKFMKSHIDARESIFGVVRSHIYLMYGFGMSLLFGHRFLGTSLSSPVSFITNLVPGIVSLGIVDTMAAIGGTVFGGGNKLSIFLINKWFPSHLNTAVEHKTFAGVFSGAFFGVIFWLCTQELICVYFIEVCPELRAYPTVPMIIMVSVFESLSDGIDNLQLPLMSLATFYTIASAKLHH